MRQVIQDLSGGNGAAGQQAMNDPVMRGKIEKLIASGVLQTGVACRRRPSLRSLFSGGRMLSRAFLTIHASTAMNYRAPRLGERPRCLVVGLSTRRSRTSHRAGRRRGDLALVARLLQPWSTHRASGCIETQAQPLLIPAASRT